MRKSVASEAVVMAAALLAVVPLSAQIESPKAVEQGKLYSQPVTTGGQPDLQGYWNATPTGTFDITDPRTGGGRLEEIIKVRAGQTRIPKPSRVVDPPDGKVPYQPWAAAKQKELAAHIDDPVKPEQIDPAARCLLDGATRAFFHAGFSITQIPGYVIFQWEQNSEYRIVPLDDSPHVGEDLKLWLGDSRGHWEGKTLVIDITSLNAKTRLDMVGDFYSDKAHVVERFTRLNEKTIKYEALITDPTIYTRPWTLAGKFTRSHANEPDYELWEDACHEGERSSEKMIIPANVAKANAAREKSSGKVSH